jgi:hypothetical protein
MLPDLNLLFAYRNVSLALDTTNSPREKPWLAIPGEARDLIFFAAVKKRRIPHEFFTDRRPVV